MKENSVTERSGQQRHQPTIGVLGGMSHQATGHYYQRLNELLNETYGGWDNGEIIVVSVNFGNIERFVRQGQWNDASNYLNDKISRLEQAGADVIICVSNTMHQVVAPIMADKSIPFIHIADPTGEAIAAAGLTKILLLGTLPVMKSANLVQRYRENFGIEIVAPSDADKTIIDHIIFDQLVRGDIRAEAKAEYLRIIQTARDQNAQGVILGCTEIFLLIDQNDLPDYPVFDTAELHIRATVTFIVQDQKS